MKTRIIFCIVLALSMNLTIAVPVSAGPIKDIGITPSDDRAGVTTDYQITFTPKTGEATAVSINFSAFGTTGTDMILSAVSTNISDYLFTGFSANPTGVVVNDTTKIITFTGGATTKDVEHTIINNIAGTGLVITNDQNSETKKVSISTATDLGESWLAINPGAIDHYSVSNVNSPQLAGTPIAVSIQAQDQFNNDISDGADASENITISFAKADAGATPTSTVTNNGKVTVGITMTVAQTGQSITFTGDTSGKTGTSNSFDVIPGAIDHYSVSNVNSPLFAGTPIAVSIQAQDQFNNDISDGSDASENITISFAKADAKATPTSTVTNNGKVTVEITMKVAQTGQRITFTGDTSGKTGTSNSFDVIVYAVGGVPKIGSSPGITYVYDIVTTRGEFTEDITVKSEDGLVKLTINEGTVGLGLTEKGEFLEKIIVDEMEDPPTPPKDSAVIGLTYNLGPDGATFDPPITLTFTYNPDEVPEDIQEENLVIAYYDEAADKWVECDSESGLEAYSIKALVSHFTPFAVIGRVVPAPPPPVPAAFSISSLSIQPREVQPEEVVIIAVSVANTGGKEGSYIVVLKINDVKEAEKKVTVAAGSTQDVSFTITKVEAGSYCIVVDGLSGSFVVVAPPPQLLPPPPVPVAKPPMNWPLIGGAIAAGLVVGGVIIFFLVIKRRKH